MKCPTCGNDVQATWKLCPFCGTQMPAPATPGASIIAVGEDGIVRTEVSANAGPAAAGQDPPPAGGRPVIHVGNDAVVKATVDASSHVTHDRSVNLTGSTYVQQQHVVNESTIASLLRLASGNGKLNELEAQVERMDWGNDPRELRTLFRKHLAVIEEESFGDTVRAFWRSYFTFGTYGLMGPGNASKERKLRLRVCRSILDTLEDLGPTAPEASTVLADCRARYDRAVDRSKKRLWVVLGVVGVVIFFYLCGMCAVAAGGR